METSSPIGATDASVLFSALSTADEAALAATTADEAALAASSAKAAATAAAETTVAMDDAADCDDNDEVPAPPAPPPSQELGLGLAQAPAAAPQVQEPVQEQAEALLVGEESPLQALPLQVQALPLLQAPAAPPLQAPAALPLQAPPLLAQVPPMVHETAPHVAPPSLEAGPLPQEEVVPMHAEAVEPPFAFTTPVTALVLEGSTAMAAPKKLQLAETAPPTPLGGLNDALAAAAAACELPSPIKASGDDAASPTLDITGLAPVPQPEHVPGLMVRTIKPPLALKRRLEADEQAVAAGAAAAAPSKVVPPEPPQPQVAGVPDAAKSKPRSFLPPRKLDADTSARVKQASQQPLKKRAIVKDEAEDEAVGARAGEDTRAREDDGEALGGDWSCVS